MKTRTKFVAATAFAMAVIGISTFAVNASSVTMENTYIKVTVGESNGRFYMDTVEGNPAITTDNNKKLLYHTDSDPWSSYSTVVVDNQVYIYGDNGFTSAPKTSSTGKQNTSTAKYGDIQVTQTLSFVKNVSTNRDDVVEIKYTVKNTGNTSHTVGMRIMLDTMLGSNDKAPFKIPGIGDVTTENEFSGNNIPQYWQAFDSLTDPKVMSQGSFLRSSENKPDKVQFTNWGSVKNASWDYKISEGRENGDSAVSVIWNEKALAAGQTRNYVTYYGISELTVDSAPPLSLGAYCDASATITGHNTDGTPKYSSIDFTAYVENVGTDTAKNAYVNITLPSGITLKSGSSKYTYSTLAANTSKQVSWTLNIDKNIQPGTYQIKVTCGADQISAKTVTRTITIPTDPYKIVKNTSTVSSTNIALGSSVTLKGSASDGSKPYQYAYYYKLSSSSDWTVLKSYSTTASATFKPEKEGKYDIRINVKDAENVIARKDFSLTVGPTLANTSTVSATKIDLGMFITAKGAATGGKAPYTYAYYYKKNADTKWTAVKDYSTTTSVSIKPAAATKYDICIKAKDANGSIVKKYFTVNVNPELKNNSTISSTKITVGSSVTLKGSASGGSSSYKYAYYYKKASDTKWTVAKDYSTTASVSIKPAKETTYDVCIKVKDSVGQIVKKYFTVNVTSSLKVNSSVVLKASATGGQSPYTYAFYYKQTSSTKWVELQAYSSANSVVFAPAQAGTYDICIKAKDSNGKISKQYYTIGIK